MYNIIIVHMKTNLYTRSEFISGKEYYYVKLNEIEIY
jgi:hypothetical protein